jgi:hypothetical protein
MAKYRHYQAIQDVKKAALLLAVACSFFAAGIILGMMM